MMKVTKAVVTAGNPDHRSLPLHRLVSQQGEEKSILRLLIDEVASAKIEDAAVIICPGVKESYERSLEGTDCRVHFIEQSGPRGYDKALLHAEEFVDGSEFLHLVGDHLYVSNLPEKTCAQQVVERAQQQKCSLSAVQEAREPHLKYFGIVAGKPGTSDGLYDVLRVEEKPTPTLAEQELLSPGLRAGSYLAIFGMHVLSATIFRLIRDNGGAGDLSRHLTTLAATQKYVATRLEGQRYDLGQKYGVFRAQLALALKGSDRDKFLVDLIDQLTTTVGGTFPKMG